MSQQQTLSGWLRVMTFLAILTSSGGLAGGCAVYQHQIIEPAEAAGPVPREEVVFHIEPLEYRAAERGHRLALRIVNTANVPVILLGERSYLVDPAGETRAIGGGTIAPGSFVTLVLPPVVDRVRTGPRFGVGVGVGTGFRGGAGHFGTGLYHHRWAAHPAYVGETVPIWRWQSGIVRMRLAYEHETERFDHELVFDRVKVQ